jgi:hypothetical protein
MPQASGAQSRAAGKKGKSHAYGPGRHSRSTAARSGSINPLGSNVVRSGRLNAFDADTFATERGIIDIEALATW